jgi:hypothetical protein
MIEVRRILTRVEDIFHEGGPLAAVPPRRGAIGAVLRNPYSGRHEPDLMPMMEALQPLGVRLAHALLAAMAVPGERIESYGKGAIIGEAGELEHGALWHVPGGYAMRELLGWKGSRSAYTAGQGAPAAGAKKEQSGNALAIVPSTKKVGAAGCTLDIPLTHINASYVRSHFDAVEFRIPGAPRADEVVVVLAMSTGARVHARVGGLKAADIAVWDGQR